MYYYVHTNIYTTYMLPSNNLFIHIHTHKLVLNFFDWCSKRWIIWTLGVRFIEVEARFSNEVLLKPKRSMQQWCRIIPKFFCPYSDYKNYLAWMRQTSSETCLYEGLLRTTQFGFIMVKQLLTLIQEKKPKVLTPKIHGQFYSWAWCINWRIE